MKNTIYCLLICYIGIWASCNKNFDCRGTIHNFEAFYKAYPDADSIHVGDTIWIELSTSTQLKDVTTGEMINFSDAGNFGTVIGYGEMTGGDVINPGGIPAANDFESIVINGTSVPPLRPEELREFLFEEKNGMYLFKVGIIPKKKGLFMISPSDASNVYQKSNNCRKSNFRLTFKETDKHLYLYERNRPGYTPSEYERAHAYCFKVY